MADLSKDPPRIHMDGEEWCPWSYALDLRAALRRKQRSDQSHAHQFAAINDLYENLPASHAQAPYAKSAEAFRKHALIETGHCDVTTIDCETHEAAKRVAPELAKQARKAHGYALIIVRGPLVVCSTPHSQSYKAMGKERFQKSKDDVLAWAETLLGIEKAGAA